MQQRNIIAFPQLPSLQYYFTGYETLHQINSKAHFPINSYHDLPLLCILSTRPVMGYNELTEVIYKISQRSDNTSVISYSLKRLLKAGYIQKYNNTAKYCITLAGIRLLHSFNDTLESLVKQKLCALADRMEAEANK